jgi:hypothetical protein
MANTTESTELITKAEAARRFGVTRQAVNKYVKQQQMPVDASGLIPWEAAKEWHGMYICSHRSGSFFHRLRMKEQAQLTAGNAEPTEMIAGVDMSGLTDFEKGAIGIANALRSKEFLQFIAELVYTYSGDVKVAYRVAYGYDLVIALQVPSLLGLSEDAEVIAEYDSPDWSAWAKTHGAKLSFKKLDEQAAAGYDACLERIPGHEVTK